MVSTNVKLKLIQQSITGFARRVWRFPQAVSRAVRWSLASSIRARAEAERLDRIRNPSKYLGK
jgi:hypothetical protein